MLNSEITGDRERSRREAAVDLSDAHSMVTMSAEVMKDAYLDFVSTIFFLFIQTFN